MPQKRQNPVPGAIRPGSPNFKPNPRFKANYIKASIPPLDFYRAELNGLRIENRRRWIDGGLCPFHDDTKSGSFRVNMVTGAFNCFACGHSGGDIIAFTRLLYDLSFPDALARLTQDWGL